MKRAVMGLVLLSLVLSMFVSGVACATFSERFQQGCDGAIEVLEGAKKICEACTPKPADFKPKEEEEDDDEEEEGEGEGGGGGE